MLRSHGSAPSTDSEVARAYLEVSNGSGVVIRSLTFLAQPIESNGHLRPGFIVTLLPSLEGGAFRDPDGTSRTVSAGHFLLRAVVVMLVLCVSAVTGAEELPVEDEQLEVAALELLREETVSSASRYEQPISQAPANIYVITEEDIRQSGAIDIPTLLRLVPGMDVMQLNGADFDVSVRGDNQLGSNKLLVLVDGRSIYEANQKAVTDGIGVTICIGCKGA